MSAAERDERVWSRANQLVEEWLPPYHTEQDAFRGIDKAATMVAALEEELLNRKPRTICFVILDGEASPQARYATKAAAEEVRDAWVAAHESAGVPYNFRVAEIVEATP